MLDVAQGFCFSWNHIEVVAYVTPGPGMNKHKQSVYLDY